MEVDQSQRQIQQREANFNLYFLKGNDKRLLSERQQQQILEIVKFDPLSRSFFIFNQNEIFRKMDKWQKNMSWIKPYYAVKSCAFPKILQAVRSKGGGVDCASKSEIELSLSLGFHPTDIIYSNPIKSEKDLIYAQQQGVMITTADTIEELVKIKKYAPTMRVLWRVSFDLDESDVKLVVNFCEKFGDDIFSDQQIENRMKQISDMGISLIGTHFHCGCAHEGATGHRKGIDLCRRIFQIARKYGHEMTIMDLGGGFSGREVSQAFIQTLAKTKNDPLGYQVIAEPGRHFSTTCFFLLIRIIGKQIRNGHLSYFVNDSMFLNLLGTKIDEIDLTNEEEMYSKISSKSKETCSSFSKEKATIFGMTCDSTDFISVDVVVPQDLQIGDWLCLEGMGAYTFSMSSNYNGMKNQKFVLWSSPMADTF